MGLTKDVAVVGAGISGLALAHGLKKQGKNVTVFEASAEAGGKIRTQHVDGFELDLGPVSCVETPVLKQLLSDLNLEDKILQAKSAVSRRYIYSKGKIHAVEPSPPKLLMHPMLSWRGRFGLLKDVFIAPASEQTDDESVAAFARRHFGDEAYQRLFNPVLNGIYAGNPEALSLVSTLSTVKELAKKYGSVIKGLRAEKDRMKSSRKIITLRGGFGKLIETLRHEQANNIRLSTEVKSLKLENEGVRLFVRNGEGESQHFFSKVYLTLPAYAAASVLNNVDPQLSTSLSSVRYNKVWQVYGEATIPDHLFDGFGFLVPAEEKLSLLGAICISNIFPDKAPAGKKLFALFCGGERPYPFAPDVNKAVSEFKSILPVVEFKTLHIQEWNEAIPQFYVGHQAMLQKLKEFETKHPAIAFGGNYVSGVSLGDCVAYGSK